MNTTHCCGYQLTLAGKAVHALVLAHHIVEGTVEDDRCPSDARHYEADVRSLMFWPTIASPLNDLPTEQKS
jgi:hypothetical protein